MKAFIRKNTKELRNKLKNMGYTICPCTEYENAVWLDILDLNNSIHGVGFVEEDLTGRKTVQAELDFFLYENSNSKNPAIDCNDNEEKFITIAKEIINEKN